MEFGVLGPLVVVDDSGSVVLARNSKQRILLALLLCDAGSTVSASRMIDAIWSGPPPAEPYRALQVYLHRLRLALGPGGHDRIVHRPPGYRLNVRPGELDEARFAELAADGRRAFESGDYARCADRMRSALRLWRGMPLADLSDVPALAGTIKRLTESRLTALETRIDAELAMGRHREVVGELFGLVGDFPLRERFTAQLITALYRSGRQTEALAAFRRTRRWMREELGLDPGTELRELERAILRGDPTLDLAVRAAPVIAPAQLPAAAYDFTGRTRELGQVTGVLGRSDAVSGSGERAGLAVVTVCGPPGTGKSTLALQAAQLVRAEYPDGQLYADLRGSRAEPLPPETVLDRFLRSLGVPSKAIPPDPDERAALYRSRLADRRVLVLLDDARDEAQVRPLLPGTPTSGAIVTARGPLPGLRPAAAIRLGRLGPAEALELLAGIAGRERVAAQPIAAREIIEFCDRLPLAIRIAAARTSVRQQEGLSRLTRRLHDERTRLDELRIGELDIRAAIEPGYASLDEPARRCFLTLAAAGGSRMSPGSVAALLGVSHETADDLLDTLLEAGLLDAVSGPIGLRWYVVPGLCRLFALERAGTQRFDLSVSALADRVSQL